MPGLIDRFLNTEKSGKAGANPVSDLLRQCKKSFVFVAVLTFVIEILSITPIVFMWNMFDRVISSRSMVTLVSLTSLVMLAYGFWSGLEWVRTRMMIRISLRIDWDIAARVFDTSFRRYVARKDVDVHHLLAGLFIRIWRCSFWWRPSSSCWRLTLPVVLPHPLCVMPMMLRHKPNVWLPRA